MSIHIRFVLFDQKMAKIQIILTIKLFRVMGEYSDELDRYLEAYEEKIGKTLRVPEQLIQRKLINQSIESGLF